MDDSNELSNDLISGEYELTDNRLEKVIYNLDIHNNLENVLKLNYELGYKNIKIEFYDRDIIIYQNEPVHDVRIKKYNINSRDGVILTKIAQKKNLY